jgi:hypothetical protein
MEREQVNILVEFLKSQFDSLKITTTFDTIIKKWCVEINDYQIYTSDEFKNALVFLRQETEIQFYCCFRSNV